MKWRLLSHDPLTGLKTYHAYDSVTKQNHIRTEQDVQHILDENQRSYSSAKAGWGGDWHYVAEIPMEILHKWQVEEGLDFYNKDHWPAIKRKLNSNEFRKFRTKHGNI